MTKKNEIQKKPVATSFKLSIKGKEVVSVSFTATAGFIALVVAIGARFLG